MTQLLPEFGTTLDTAAVAEALGVERGDVDAAPPQVVSCGVPFLFVPLRTRSAVDGVAIDSRKLARACRETGRDGLPVFIFTLEGGSAGETIYSRMLAPGFGIAEDPATGSASGPLGCYLLHHGMLTAGTARQMVSLQGAAMKRPSRLHISIDSENGRITRVRVGGRSILVGRGELYV
jgi:trans-2,3-dihydro-3-hydroxyanthranilate isomerase